jgi:uncharacterized protein (DUF302 family)
MSESVRDSGIIRIPSVYSAAVTLERLETIIQARGLDVFARIRFSEDARRAELDMRFTELVLFGNPRAGTPIMVAAPSAALDLPLKALVEEDAVGTIWLSCNDPEYLQRRHGIPFDLTKNIAGAEAILREVGRAT